MSVFILFTFCSISGTFKTFKFTSLFLRQKKKKKTQWIIQWEYQADLLKLYQIEICDFFFFLNGSKLRKS